MDLIATGPLRIMAATMHDDMQKKCSQRGGREPTPIP